MYIRNLFFPPRCVGCGELLPPFDPHDAVFCPFCRTAWEAAFIQESDPALTAPLTVSDARGDRCGMPIAILSLVTYHPGETDGVPQKMIYHLKHRDDRRVFDWVAERLAGAVSARLNALEIDPQCVVYTYPPRRRVAVRKDGFDQAEQLCKRVAGRLGGVCLPVIRRTHPWTRGAGHEQKRLDAAERRINAAASYRLHPRHASRVADRPVVLIDDLLTTGSTLARCTDLLLSANATAVLWLTVGRTMSGLDPQPNRKPS